MRRPLATAALLTPLFALRLAAAQEYAPPPAAAPPALPAQPQCTTTTTTTTTCTGTAAPLAVPGATGAIVQPMDVPGPMYPQPAYAWPPPAQPAPYPYPMNLPPPPPLRQAHAEMRPRYGLMAGGLSMFGSVYLMNAAFAYMSKEGSLAIPIVGPLVLMGDLNNRNANRCCTDDFSNRMAGMLLVFDAVVQATGATMFLVGMLTKKKVMVYEKDDVKMTLVPTAGAGGGGVGVVGVF